MLCCSRRVLQDCDHSFFEISFPVCLCVFFNGCYLLYIHEVLSNDVDSASLRAFSVIPLLIK